MKTIQNLRTNNLKTINLAGNKLIPLSQNENNIFQETIQCLLNNVSIEDGVTITFRGFSRTHILTSLTKEDKALDENKLFELLFYFGEKAKHYYKVDNVEAGKSRWIKNIEDCSYSTTKVIFEKIREILKIDNEIVSAFKKNAPEFTSYFETVK